MWKCCEFFDRITHKRVIVASIAASVSRLNAILLLKTLNVYQRRTPSWNLLKNKLQTSKQILFLKEKKKKIRVFKVLHLGDTLNLSTIGLYRGRIAIINQYSWISAYPNGEKRWVSRCRPKWIAKVLEVIITLSTVSLYRGWKELLASTEAD